MTRFLLKLVVFLLRLIYGPLKLLPIRRKITIISRQSNQPTTDIRLLRDYLQRRYPDTECVVLTKFIGSGIGGKLIYMFHMPVQMYHMATSRVVVLDGYCIAACVLRHKAGTKILQMWHALAAIKKFGWQTIDRPAGHSFVVAETMRMHHGYDYIVCPGEEVGRVFCEAFKAEKERLLYRGLPRLDLICAEAEAEAPQSLRQQYGIPQDRELLLYVPTFRKGETIPLEDLIRATDPDRFVLVIKLHPLEHVSPAQEAQVAEANHVIIETQHSSYEWLKECDRVITDYSALGVEASLTDKPLYFYVYDIDQYVQNVGLNIDPRAELPQASALTGPQLAQMLAQDYDYDALRRFRDKYISIDPHNCTEKLGDFIYGIISETL